MANRRNIPCCGGIDNDGQLCLSVDQEFLQQAPMHGWFVAHYPG